MPKTKNKRSDDSNGDTAYVAIVNTDENDILSFCCSVCLMAFLQENFENGMINEIWIKNISDGLEDNGRPKININIKKK